MSKYKKPKDFDYNVVAIGGGSAGLVTSYIAAAVKAKVALIEKHKMGGDCLNTGCVPSKALIRSAKIASYFKRAKEFGFQEISNNFEFSDVMERIQRVISKVAPHDSVERYTSLGVDCFQGEAKIKSPWEIEVGDKTITTKNIVVATGAGPLIPPIPGLDEVGYLVSENVWEIRENPGRLIVLGGGPIGAELTQSFHRLAANQLLPDSDVYFATIHLKVRDAKLRMMEEGTINKDQGLFTKHVFERDINLYLLIGKDMTSYSSRSDLVYFDDPGTSFSGVMQTQGTILQCYRNHHSTDVNQSIY